MKRYLISKEARADLDGIWDFIAGRGNPENATSFIWKFYDIFTSIASSPAAGLTVPGFAPAGTRKFPMGNYLIYYRPLRGRVQILRVLHGKRVQRRAWGQLV